MGEFLCGVIFVVLALYTYATFFGGNKPWNG